MKINQLKYSEAEIRKFGEYYNNGHSLKETANYFNINYHTLKQNLIRFGYRKPNKKIQSSRVLPILYFNIIDSHEKAYFLGLLYADGYISSTPYGKNIGIALQLSDKYLLENFKLELKVNNKISIYKNSCKLQLTCQTLYNNLNKWGIHENKSHVDYNIPKIPKKYINSFILGYFDGDGCITIKKSKAIVVSMCSNSKIFLKNIQDVLSKKNIKTRPICTEKRKHNDLYILYLSKRENQIKFMNFIYNNSKYYLKRKFDKFTQIPR